MQLKIFFDVLEDRALFPQAVAKTNIQRHH